MVKSFAFGVLPTVIVFSSLMSVLYHLGGTPRSQQLGLLVGALSSSLVIGVVLLVLNNGATVYSQKNLPAAKVDVATLKGTEHVRGEAAKSDSSEYHVLNAKAGQIPGVPSGKYLVDESGAIKYLVDPGINGKLTERDDGTVVPRYNAPKAALMAFIIDGILTQKLPWTLVLLGVAIAIVLELAGVPSLPFAVGVYLPLSTSMPIFVGGMIRYVVDKWKKRSAVEGESSPGVLLSSGYIAGGAIAGIIVALTVINADVARKLSVGASWLPNVHDADWFAVVPFGLLTVFLLLVGGEKLLSNSKSQ